MLKKIAFEKLRTGDLIHCTSRSFMATAIRLREVGIKRLYDLNVATHTGIVAILNTPTAKGENVISIAEMKNEGFKLNSFSDYMKKGIFDSGIISITRHNALDDPNTLAKYKEELFRLWSEGKKYDWEGCLKWAFPFLKEKNKDFYCSELAEHLALYCGFSYYRKDIPEKPSDNVMPYTLQKSGFMTKIL